MNEYAGLRNEITETDKQLAALFDRRLKLCKQISDYKQKNGLPIRDSLDETGILPGIEGIIEDDTARSYYLRFLNSTLDICADYQEMQTGGMRIAFGGVGGAYAHIAASRMFPMAQLISKPDFSEAYKSVESGECDCAVLPIENSLAGEVGTVMDLIYQGSLHINRIYELPIRHQLLGVKGSSRESIKKVFSHPQALAQCSSYIRRHGFETETAANTSAAAERALELGDISVGAIASEETAGNMQLSILDSDIQNPGINTTRFAVFSRSLSTPADTTKHENENFILVFTVKNEAGALASTLNIIGAHGYNMRCLRSRPLKGLPWSYYFYMEAEGCIHTRNGSDLLNELSVICADLKLVGTYH